jgi:hypothetical protein
MNGEKILRKVLSGSKNISFLELVYLVKAFGFGWQELRGATRLLVTTR